MTFFIGRGDPNSEDFEIEEFMGFHTSPNGKYWGSGPIGDDGILITEKEADLKEETARKYQANGYGKSKYHK